MRISDWSSDVCSSDLALGTQHRALQIEFGRGSAWAMSMEQQLADQDARFAGLDIEHDKEADAANKRQVVQLTMELGASKQDLCAMRTELDAMGLRYDSARERLTDLENALENAHQFYQRDTGDLAKQRDIALEIGRAHV